ncbi:MAG: GTPase HflX [Betaproteobacteria bacterium]|nr:GTPase HflX [Betaproteobacteria bacterium]
MIERPRAGEKALLVAMDLGDPGFSLSRDELQLLAVSAGLTVLGTLSGRRSRIDAATFAGSGKVQEIADAARETGANVVIFNHVLSPAQERNLEEALKCRVVDRVALILDIFAQRARSHEGKLQVELAQLTHLSTRLVRGWTHLERQQGGIGLRGPGETQLETDRRLIGKRVKILKDRIATVRKQHDVQRRARSRNKVFSVSVVGYTNAGKSTLFNRLTKSKAYAADQLFATVDTTSRRLVFPSRRHLVLSDTVGFIRDLPHTLVAAFRATLEETARADLLLHVVDAANAGFAGQIEQVNGVLAEIGAGEIPQIMVHNKIDAAGLTSALERDEYGSISRVRVSARTGEGIDMLRAAIEEQVPLPRMREAESPAAVLS